MKLYGQLREARTLDLIGKVYAGLFKSILRRAQDDSRQFPKFQETGLRSVRGGEKDVGVKEKPVHKLKVLLRETMGDVVRIQAQFFDLAAGAAVIGQGGGIG